MKQTKFWLLTAIFTLCAATTTWGWDGSGSASDPYLIASIDDMTALATSVANGEAYDGKYFKLTADLDYSDEPLDADGNNFRPIGGGFKGNFDGGGHFISGIIANSSPFKTVAQERTLKDLTIKNATINCSHDVVGGMVGRNGGRVENCHVAEDVAIIGNSAGIRYSYLGGIVGSNAGAIWQCSSAAVITKGGARIGGIAGDNVGNINNCVFVGTTLEGFDHVAAIAGYWTGSNGTLSGCFYLNNALKAYCDADGNGKDISDTPRQDLHKVILGPLVTATRRNTSQMTVGNVAVYSDGMDYKDTLYCVTGTCLDLGCSTEGFAARSFSCIGEESSVTGTTLTVGTADVTVNAAFWAGDGTESNPWLITSANDWDCLAAVLQSGDYDKKEYFKLTGDITVTTMIGTEESPFEGTLDGDGHTLTADLDYDEEGVAPFHYIKDATIKNLTVDGTISGGNYSAGLVGFSTRRPQLSSGNYIEECKVEATIKSNGAYAGGIVGCNAAFLELSGTLFDGTIQGESGGNTSAGAFIGWGTNDSHNNISGNCLASGEYTSCTITDVVNVEQGGVVRCYGYKLFSDGQYGYQLFTSPTDGKLWSKVTAIDGNAYYIPVKMVGLEANYVTNVASMGYHLTPANEAGWFEENVDYTVLITDAQGNEDNGLTRTGPHTITITATSTGRLTGSESYSFNVILGIELDGQGTKSDPYRIHNYENVSTLANAVNNGFPTQGLFFDVRRDFIVPDKLPAIGTPEHPFEGYFEGNGCCIHMSVVGDADSDYQGFFGYVGEHGVIKDLTIGMATVTGKQYVGAIAGYNKGTINRCFSIDNTLTGQTHLGAIAGGNEGIITDSYYLNVNINGQQAAGTGCDGADAEGTVCVHEVNLVGLDLTNAERWYQEDMTIYDDNGIFFEDYYEKIVHPASFAEGAVVKLKLQDTSTDARYLQATDKDGNLIDLDVTYHADGTFSFIMPAFDIFVKNSDVTMLTLFNDKDNTSSIDYFNNATANVRLSGRTFNADGSWNTLCLPFAVSDFTGTVLENAVAMQLDAANSRIEGNTLILNFTEATALEAGKPYLVKWGKDFVNISSKADWDAFANRVNAGETTLNARLTADITEAVTTTIGTDDNKYSGTFDGGGHSLNVRLMDTSDSGVAPFRFIANAHIKNLKVAGEVIGSIHCAGLVGSAADNSVNTIENCEVAANITTYDQYCGGFLGHGNKSNTTISNCLFSGYINGMSTPYIGIFYGWGDAPGVHTIKNCMANGVYRGGGIDLVNVNGGIVSVTNCYKNTSDGNYGTYTSATGSELAALLGQGWQVEGGEVKPAKESSTLTDASFLNVGISNAHNDVTSADGAVAFCGLFSPYAISGEDRSLLYLGADNKLYYPNAAMNIGSCRAYFQLKGGNRAGEPTSGEQGISRFVLNFGDGEQATGISLSSLLSPLSSNENTWYSLDGRRLTGKPTQKGVYINNGRKVVIGK